MHFHANITLYLFLTESSEKKNTTDFHRLIFKNLGIIQTKLRIHQTENVSCS